MNMYLDGDEIMIEASKLHCQDTAVSFCLRIDPDTPEFKEMLESLGWTPPEEGKSD